MNLIDILKHCPKGMKLYSPLFGYVYLERVELLAIFVRVKATDDFWQTVSFNFDGNFYENYNGECLLFPSKEKRNWNDFKIPVKNGDIMMIDNRAFITTGKTNEYNEPFVYCGINPSNILEINPNVVWTSIFYIPASEEVKKQLFKALKENGYKWDSKNKCLKRINTPFKPFDKVLVRNNGDIKGWQPAWFKEYITEENNIPSLYPYKTMKDTVFNRCIYYKGNEHLCFTNKDPE